LGVLFRSGDADDLGRRLDGLLDDQARRAGLGAAAAAAVRRYDWDTVAERVLRVYETVLGDDGGPVTGTTPSSGRSSSSSTP
jgi:phosphatidylinositol alpha-mannosyltransferase